MEKTVTGLHPHRGVDLGGLRDVPGAEKTLHRTMRVTAAQARVGERSQRFALFAGVPLANHCNNQWVNFQASLATESRHLILAAHRADEHLDFVDAEKRLKVLDAHVLETRRSCQRAQHRVLDRHHDVTVQIVVQIAERSAVYRRVLQRIVPGKLREEQYRNRPAFRQLPNAIDRCVARIRACEKLANFVLVERELTFDGQQFPVATPAANRLTAVYGPALPILRRTEESRRRAMVREGL